MFKKILLLFFMFTVPVYAGVYEDALAKSDNVFLYFYTPECKTCRNFDKTFNNIQKKINDFQYVKVNADTLYGNRLMTNFNGRYVPYIILTNSKTNKSVSVNHSCVMDEICLVRALKSFKG